MLLANVSSHVNQTKCTDTSFEYYIIKLQQSHWICINILRATGLLGISPNNTDEINKTNFHG
jgi:hypothetical protein